jgi:hypothetical protein
MGVFRSLNTQALLHRLALDLIGMFTGIKIILLCLPIPHSYTIVIYSQPDTFTAPADLSTANVGVSKFDFPSYVKVRIWSHTP